jgi:hypothetical protein
MRQRNMHLFYVVSGVERCAEVRCAVGSFVLRLARSEEGTRGLEFLHHGS